MDDMLLFAGDKETLRGWRSEVERFARTALALELRADAERLAPVRVGVPFLGFRIWPGLVRLDAARARRLGRRLRALATIEDPDDRQRRASSVLDWAAQADSARLRTSLMASKPGVVARSLVYDGLGEG